MSSSSDQEDFFDAADETPFDSLMQGGSSKSITLSEIEEEERRLLQMRYRAEERRRREDEELEHRLSQLQQKKKRESEMQDGDWHDQEHEVRQRKLEDMRQALGSNRSNQSGCSTTSHGSSMDNDSPNTSSDIPDNFALSSPCPATTPKSHTIEKMENNGSPNTCRHHAKKRSGSWGDLPKNDSALKVTGPPTDLTNTMESTSSQSSQMSNSGALNVSAARCSRSNSKDGALKLLNPENKLSNLDLNMDRFQPEKEKQNKSLTLLINDSKLTATDMSTNSVVDNILQQTQVQTTDCEPDIVKSTKAQRTPPPTHKPSDAPPRRKKSRSQSQCSSSSNEKLGLPSFNLPPHLEPPSPKLGQDRTLDVKSAIEGSRLIHTQEAECGLGAVPKKYKRASDAGFPSARDGVAGTSNLIQSNTMDDNTTESLAVQIQQWQALGRGEKEASPKSRPRSNSGKPLTDQDILDLVTVRNLDTGELIPLSTAEDKLPKCVDPLALHMKRRAKEYSSDTSLHVDDLSDESDSRSEKSVASASNIVRRKGLKIRKIFGKTVSKVKIAADQALHSDHGPVEEEVSVDGKVFKIKSSSKNKGPYDFSQPNILQELSGEHTGAIWTMKFSPCGKLLATGGQDSTLRIWVLKSTYSYFEDFRQKYSDVRLSPAESHESLNSASSDFSAAMDPLKELNPQAEEDEVTAPFRRRPFCVYKGHTADLLDLSWSKNYFILSSSMDKTVKLWHISRRECLCTFQHIDFVTAIVFHPKDDRYFLSGSLDGKLRLWNIPDKKVTLWNELSGSSNLITTATFCYNGRLAVVGTYDGKCIFYTTDQLKYYTMVNVRSTRGKNSKGRKITGIESMPGEEKILVTSNDSRMRMYNLKDLTLSCKYKGGANNSSQIRGSFSPTGKYIICGSEDHFLYVWKAHHEFIKFTSARRDRNVYWEAIKIHNAVVTSAIFAPNPSFIFRMAEQEYSDPKMLGLDDDTEDREIIVSADFTGAIKVMTNRPSRK